MKRVGTAFALMGLVAACTSYETEPNTVADPIAPDAQPGSSVTPDGGEPPPSKPPPTPITAPPAPDELTEQYGVFVTEKGNDDAAGTRDAPFATLKKAIEAGKAASKRVYVCAGTFRESVVLEDAIPIVGGLDCSQPRAWKTSELFTRLEAPTSPALSANKISSATRVEGLEVVAPDAVTPSGTSIGFMANEASKLTLVRSRILAGRAASGVDGVEGPVQSDSGTPAQAGRAAGVYTSQTSGGPGGGGGPFRCSDNIARNAGGTSVCVATPGVNGGAGGMGGYPGRYKESNTTWVAVNLVALPNGCHHGAAGLGEPRSYVPNPHGDNGASASSWGALTVNGFVPANGSAGKTGQPGGGGSGAGGSAPGGNAPPSAEYVGNAGPGGGAGGCPGVAGSPGQGGGASLGALLVASPMTFDHVEIIASDGGAGGKGTFGSYPTKGGAAGVPVAGLAALPGQDGGNSGWSGSGAGGPSFGIAHTLGIPTLVDSKVKAGRPGLGVAARTQGPKTIAVSANGVAQDTFEFGN